MSIWTRTSLERDKPRLLVIRQEAVQRNGDLSANAWFHQLPRGNRSFGEGVA